MFCSPWLWLNWHTRCCADCSRLCLGCSCYYCTCRILGGPKKKSIQRLSQHVKCYWGASSTVNMKYMGLFKYLTLLFKIDFLYSSVMILVLLRYFVGEYSFKIHKYKANYSEIFLLFFLFPNFCFYFCKGNISTICHTDIILNCINLHILILHNIVYELFWWNFL